MFSSCDRCDEKRENILLSEDNDVNKNDNSNGDRKTLCRGRRESASLKRARVVYYLNIIIEVEINWTKKE